MSVWSEAFELRSSNNCHSHSGFSRMSRQKAWRTCQRPQGFDSCMHKTLARILGFDPSKTHSEFWISKKVFQSGGFRILKDQRWPRNNSCCREPNWHLRTITKRKKSRLSRTLESISSFWEIRKNVNLTGQILFEIKSRNDLILIFLASLTLRCKRFSCKLAYHRNFLFSKFKQAQNVQTHSTFPTRSLKNKCLFHFKPKGYRHNCSLIKSHSNNFYFYGLWFIEIMAFRWEHWRCLDAFDSWFLLMAYQFLLASGMYLDEIVKRV